MTAASVQRALGAARDWLAARDAPEGTIALHEAGRAENDEGARRWTRRLLDGQGPDGAWDGDLIATASTLMTLAEIRAAAGLREQDPAIGRGLDWIRSRRGAVGSWTDGCSPVRHRLGTCHHFLGGFFSPGPPEVPILEATLRSGARATRDVEVRFVASTTALRCLLHWEEASADARLHLRGLRRVVQLWPDTPPGGLSTVAFLSAVQALLRSPVEEDRAAALRGLRWVAGKQRGDGSWVDTDAFQALEVFGDADAEDLSPDRSHRALWHAARLLVSTQNGDGSWGGDQAARRALIAWRTLRLLEQGSRE